MTSSRRLGLRQRGSAALALAWCLVALLAACGTTANVPSRAAATPTPTPTPPPPVTIALAVRQTGTVAAGTVHLVVQTTVTNHTSATVALTAVDCPPDVRLPLVFLLNNAQGQNVWEWSTSSVICIFGVKADTVHIAAGGSYARTETLDLSGVNVLQTGQRYALIADDLLWHQGTISQTGQLTGPQGYACGQTTIVLM